MQHWDCAIAYTCCIGCLCTVYELLHLRMLSCFDADFHSCLAIAKLHSGFYGVTKMANRHVHLLSCTSLLTNHSHSPLHHHIRHNWLWSHSFSTCRMLRSDASVQLPLLAVLLLLPHSMPSASQQAPQPHHLHQHASDCSNKSVSYAAPEDCPEEVAAFQTSGEIPAEMVQNQMTRSRSKLNLSTTDMLGAMSLDVGDLRSTV